MNFSIYFAGAVLPGHDASQVARKLQERTRISEEKVEALFSGDRKLIKKNLDREGAEKFASMMSSLGAEVEVHPPLSGSADISLDLVEIESKPAVEEAPVEQEQQTNPYSATVVSGPRVFCRFCGASIAPKASNCPQCGGPQQIGVSKSPVVAAVLAFFMGGFGIHRLYLGQWWGIFYLFIWPISSFVSLVEMIVFLCTSKESWEGKYGNVQGSNTVIVAIVAVFFGVFMLGILAAIAVPAYQDYTLRSQVSASIVETRPIRDEIAALEQRTGYVAMHNSDIGLDEQVATAFLSSVEVGEQGILTLTFSTPALSGETLIWTPLFSDAGAQWDCTGGTLAKRYRPADCRMQ